MSAATAAAAPLVSATDIVQEYLQPDGKMLRVLDGVSLAFERPSINMLLGPSGCGKSTLLRMLGGVRPWNVTTPTSGAVQIDGSGTFADAISKDGAVADPMLLQRLGLKVGDVFKIGETDVTVQGVLKAEPDAVADRLTYGPRVFVSTQTLEKTGLVKPGTLIRWRYAVQLPEGTPAGREDLKALREGVQKELPEAGFSSADRHDPSPQITRTLDRLRQFLILIGLASLLVGGVGVGNAVATFVDKRLKIVATLRAVGATGSQIMGIFLVQILVMTVIGTAIGLALGVLIPGIIDWLYADALPIRAEFSVSPKSLVMAACYGLLVSLLFALWPLGRTQSVKASVLFRDAVVPVTGRPGRGVLILCALCLAGLIGLAVFTSEPKTLALYMLGGMALSLLVFSWLGRLMTRLARQVPKPASPALALAVRNVGAPDGLTRSVVLSLGTGLSLLVAVALANSSLVDELKGRLPADSPDYFLLDVAKDDMDAVSARVRQAVPGAVLSQAPMLRGRLVKLKGRPVEELKARSDTQWVLNSDRGLSYSDTVPEGSKVIAGDWWGANYQGPPLVSFEEELAKKFDLAIGDSVTVNILGRNVEAKIANLREVKWESLAINFIMVFSPNTLQAAPHNFLATIRLPEATGAAAEVGLMRDMAKAYPAVSAIRVRDAIDQFNKVFAKVMTAVQVAGSVTLVAGALVLAGALAIAQRRRILEAVILKTIGARRRQILAAHAYEYAILALVAAVVAILLGSLSAYVGACCRPDHGFWRLGDMDNFESSLSALFEKRII
jgi:putative ABC transport system permease protein